MKLLRIGPRSAERPAILDSSGNPRDLSGVVDDIGGWALTPAGLSSIASINPQTLPQLDPGRIGSCVGGTGKFICIGLNYRDHAEESGMPIPEEPVIFMKATSAISGPNDAIVLPPGSEKTDWEIELGVIIGAAGKAIPLAMVTKHIAGYCVINDVSERAFQLEMGGQWVKGKSADTFGPIGPWLVTADEVEDPQDLTLWLDVNGERLQTGSTSNMIFSVTYLVHYVSQFMSLQPGDVISTGTPPGVGLGQNPPRYLQPGDTLRLGVDGLGEQQQEVHQGE